MSAHDTTDSTTSTHLPSTAHMEVDMADLPIDEGKCVKIVHLSGPIRIIMEIDECEKLKLGTTEQFLPLSDDKKFRVVCLSGPIKILLPSEHHDAIQPVAAGGSDHDTELPNAHTLSTSEDKPSVKDFDCNNPDDTLSPLCPYTPANEILLKTAENVQTIKAEIIKYFPATLSCCMVIRFVDPPVFNNTSECVLKLFDRRFSTQQREECEAGAWSPQLEKEYQSFVRCGDAEEYFGYWNAQKENFDDWSVAYVRNSRRWSAAKWEAYLQWMSTSMYEVEKKAYEHMIDLQGEDVPKMFGEVVLDQSAGSLSVDDIDEGNLNQTQDDSTSISSIDPDDNPHIVSIPGLLLQNANGFHLTDLHEHLPYEHWQSTVDSAIAVLHRIQECGILNCDLNTRSFMVDPLTRKIMMIDFGIVSFRGDAESEREWEMLQACEDEEGAVGLVMQGYLKERGGGKIIYKPSERTWRLGWRFRQEAGENEGGTEEEDAYVEKHKDFVFEE
ncbi:hypothetical protein D6D06_08554 [Aureobasidium pullulans]|nr:hypothetical protein D6D06_08554 [Aureobasidium pullulans]